MKIGLFGGNCSFVTRGKICQDFAKTGVETGELEEGETKYVMNQGRPPSF